MTEPAQEDMDASERLISREPVIVRRRVIWGECDPAQVVYTPRYGDYLASAFMWFARTVLGDLLKLDDGTAIGTPMKAMTLEFHRPLRVDDYFDMVVEIPEIRNRTFDLDVKALSLTGQTHFTGRLSPILIKGSTFETIEISPALREVLNAYQLNVQEITR
tara:strand:+ start:668 stop:1150 length:483 start_codon:yes stop_codon:yes gene_type:complete